jgi:hypothetical protein
MKIFLAMMLILLALARSGYGATTVFDVNNNLKYHIDDDGMIYNGQGKARARIIDNKVYDNFFNRFWFKIDGDKIYNRKDELKFRVVGYQVVDTEGKVKYYFKGTSLAECKWNIRQVSNDDF